MSDSGLKQKEGASGAERGKQGKKEEKHEKRGRKIIPLKHMHRKVKCLFR